MTYICAPIFVDLPLDNGVTVEFSPSLAPVVPIPGGPKGLDGVSPIITVTDILGGHKVTITDKDGTETFDVMDGGISQEDFLKVFPQDIASGSVASFPDGAAGVPVVDLTVDITPVQSGSGDPSPSNVRPISGWSEATLTRTGKNLLYCEAATSSTAAKVTFTNNHDGTWTLDGTATAFAGKHINAGAPLKLKAGVTYRISGGVTGVCNAYLYKNGVLKTDSGSGATYTPSTDVSGVRFYLSVASGKTADNLIVRPMLTIDGSGTEFERYNATIYTFDLDGTRYGGTLDVLTGVLTVTKSNIANYAGETLPGKWISDRDVYAPGTTPTTGAQVVYDLATQQTIQLTAQEVETLLGTNNIWADTGNTTVKYRADTGLYVQKLTGSTEEDMKANVSIASGKYFLVGNALYLSTTSIPAGDTIKPGTNCTLTNLAAALNAHNS